jgi:hypothetical protein
MPSPLSTHPQVFKIETFGTLAEPKGGTARVAFRASSLHTLAPLSPQPLPLAEEPVSSRSMPPEIRRGSQSWRKTVDRFSVQQRSCKALESYSLPLMERQPGEVLQPQSRTFNVFALRHTAKVRLIRFSSDGLET